MESFNGKLRDECLNVSWFWNIFDARQKISAWKSEYNSRRPHSSLGYLTPDEFARHWWLSSLPAASVAGNGFEFSKASAIYRPVGFRTGSGALLGSAPVLSPSR
jgi:hypothetical protein